jgi:hypothetical protein
MMIPPAPADLNIGPLIEPCIPTIGLAPTIGIAITNAIPQNHNPVKMVRHQRHKCRDT